MDKTQREICEKLLKEILADENLVTRSKRVEEYELFVRAIAVTESL